MRRYHSDPGALETAGFTLLVLRTEADDLTVDDLVDAQRIFRSAQAALDEFRYSGFGYHEKWFPNLITLLGGLDEAELRRRVLE